MTTTRSTPARRVLMVSPHFPPDSSAAAHRVRLLAPHLADAGWQPTIVTLDPSGYEGRLDPDLASLVPDSLDVVRAPVWPAHWTRRVGLGDLGLRGFAGLARTCRARLARDRYDLLFITVYPVYPALLGPRLKRTFDVPFVLDYQDPWVGEWGRTVGGGANGEADWKSRASRSLGVWLEPHAVHAADALVAVSQGTIDGILERIPEAARVPHAIVPLGFEPNDFEQLRSRPRPIAHVDPRDGLVHVCYVGTLLPKGIETLRLLLRALAHARQFSADAQRIRLHFFGTSNQSIADRHRVLPLAQECGLADVVTELPGRLDYLDALSVLTQASAIVLLGSSETHYTASKLYPALLAKRPLLALFHEASSVVSILRGAAREPSVRIVAYDERIVTHARIDEVARQLIDLGHGGEYRAEDVDLPRVMELSASHLARRLAGLFDRVVEARAATSVAA